MGLYTQLNDVSSDSIPLLVIACVANCVSYLRSSLFALLHSLGFLRLPQSDDLLGAVGSGLTRLIVLADHLNANRVFTYAHHAAHDASDHCVVCLCKLTDGDPVRRLPCRHVFHKDCLDAWLFGQLNLTCPLCRYPLVSDHRLADTQRRVAGDLVAWFSLR